MSPFLLYSLLSFLPFLLFLPPKPFLSCHHPLLSFPVSLSSKTLPLPRFCIFPFPSPLPPSQMPHPFFLFVIFSLPPCFPFSQIYSLFRNFHLLTLIIFSLFFPLVLHPKCLLPSYPFSPIPYFLLSPLSSFFSLPTSYLVTLPNFLPSSPPLPPLSLPPALPSLPPSLQLSPRRCILFPIPQLISKAKRKGGRQGGWGSLRGRGRT